MAALAFYPVVGAFAMAIAFDAPRGWVNASGLATAMLAQVTVFTTSMIYASLKTMRSWNNPLVPANYHALSLASGAAVISLLAR